MQTKRIVIAVLLLVTLLRATCGSQQPNLVRRTDTCDFAAVATGDIVRR